MRTTSGHVSIAEICDQMEREVLRVNQIYQRSSGLWPTSAKSYFIDTIINSYPFSSVYVHEQLNIKTNRIHKEIVDGQQRLTTINEFIRDRFAMGSSSREHKGKKFSQLDGETQQAILSYSVPVVTIFSPDQNEILEMFRRMNAFTVPLNPAEKRHSQFHGEFKWFVNNIADEFSPMFNSFGILTQKQIVRMSDAELITDLVDVAARGIQHRQPTAFSKLYKDNEENFGRRDEFDQKIVEVLNFVRGPIGAISGSFICKSYAFHSLVAALLHNKWSIPNGELDLEAQSTGRFATDTYVGMQGLMALSSAHESKDLEGPYSAYVDACLKATNRKAQRTARTKWILKALNGTLPG